MKKTPKWGSDQKYDSKVENKDRFDKLPGLKTEKRKQEYVPDEPVEDKLPLINDEISFDEIKPASDVYFGDIIVDPPVKEIVQKTIPVKEEKRKNLTILKG